MIPLAVRQQAAVSEPIVVSRIGTMALLGTTISRDNCDHFWGGRPGRVACAFLHAREEQRKLTCPESALVNMPALARQHQQARASTVRHTRSG